MLMVCDDEKDQIFIDPLDFMTMTMVSERIDTVLSEDDLKVTSPFLVNKQLNGNSIY